MLAGCLILFLIIRFKTFFITLLNIVGQHLHLEYLQNKIYWLLGYPAGFKPNLNLAHFLGNIVLELINIWNYLTTFMTEIRYGIISYVSLVGLFGFSVQIAAINDFIFLCSGCLLLIYSGFAFLYRNTLKMIRTLFKLFRGRKYNVIRQRDDDSDFGIAELYLGVFIITLIIFLLPTVAIYYYYAFISIILMVMSLQGFCTAGQILITEFPYFLLCWSFLQPYILPNSIRMELLP